jgi:hypothetical protein
MVYYLGRDVKVYLTTESTEAQVDVTANTVTTSDADEGISSALDFATATITITDLTELNNGDKVNLIATDTTSHDFTAGDVAGGGTWIAETSNIVSATNLSAAINANAKFSTTRVGAVITVTQATAGASGNTTVTLTDTFAAGMSKTNFTGGDDDPDFVAGQTFAENLDTSPALTKIADLTGVDLGIGITDEDVTFMGKKTVLKAEIKKETTISLTRKKNNNVWDIVYNGPTAASKGWSGTAAENGDYGARWGVIEGAADTWYINNGLMAPKDAVDYGGSVPCFGYRVHIELKSGEEVISVPGCQLTGHTISLNADGTTEETCELISHVTPKIGTAANVDRLTAADL